MMDVYGNSTYSGKVKKLKPNQVFVFGSNTQFRHGKGAARQALEFGAIYGEGGFNGQTYAIITKDLTVKRHPSISPDSIKNDIRKLYKFATDNPVLQFLVAYSGTGKNLNAYTPQEMADMFNCGNIPSNIVFEYEFSNLVRPNSII